MSNNPLHGQDKQGGTPEAAAAENKRRAKAAQAEQIRSTDPSQKEAVYLAREFILCTLPHSDPGDLLSWSRTNGNLTLGIVAGVNVQTGKSYGLPYGIMPRLLLVWIVTEILHTRCRRLELGGSLAEFLAKLGLDSSRGGPRSDARRLREQIEKLFHASIHFLYTKAGGKKSGFSWDEGMKIAPKGELWWSDREIGEDGFWGSWIEVSEAFFQAVMRSPCPLDVRVLRHIKDSALGIDLYSILNREAFLASQEGRARFLAWDWLYEQTGNEYSDVRDFRRRALVQIEAVLEVHAGLVVSIVKGRKGQKSGVLVSNLSKPSIPPEKPRRQAPEQVPEGQPARRLSPVALERFDALYHGLDLNACRAAFDAWIADKPAAREPRNYERAFLGFAAKWAKGKR